MTRSRTGLIDAWLILFGIVVLVILPGAVLWAWESMLSLGRVM